MLINNRVEVRATIDEVKTWLVQWPDGTYFFNMQRLYHQEVCADNPSGHSTWDNKWFAENTGSGCIPKIHLSSWDDGHWTYLEYETEQTPNTILLTWLHHETGWRIVNWFGNPLQQLYCEGGEWFLWDGTWPDEALELE